MRIFVSFIIFILSATCNAQELQNGDLLFNYSEPKGGFGGAIVEATNCKDDLGISHVAIVVKTDSCTCVVEATGKHGVWVCPLDTFLCNAEHSIDGTPLVLVGRLKDDSVANACVKRALQYVGRHYDWVFSDTDDAIYCSELVHLSYLDEEGKNIFPQQPMSFHGEDGVILPYWIDYYAKKGLAVPEGAHGTNPASMSKSDKIIIWKWH